MAVILWGIKLQWKGCDEQYLSVEKGRSFRGILALMVVGYHLAEQTGDNSLFHIFAFLGFLPVAYFFFLTGYGLQKSYANKPGYRITILKKRIPSVLIPYLLVTALYWLFHAVEGEVYNLGAVLRSFAEGHPFVTYSWYIVFVLVLYLGFWLVTALYRGNALQGALWNLLLVLALVVLWRALWFNMYWYNACITYVLGVLWAIKEDRWIRTVRKHVWLLLGMLIPAFGISFLATMVAVNMDIRWEVMLALYWLSSVLFTAVCLLLQMKVTFGNRLLKIMGDCSLEIYMLHGLFMNLYRGNLICLENPAAWCAAVLLSTCLAAWGLHRLLQKK